MDDNLVSVDLIMNWLTDQVRQKNPIDPHLWVEAGMKLNMLLQDEQETLFDLEQEVAKIRNIAIEGGKSVAQARSMVEETEDYKKARVQKAKIERALELIKLVKVYSRLSNDTFHA